MILVSTSFFNLILDSSLILFLYSLTRLVSFSTKIYIYKLNVKLIKKF